MSNIYLYNDDFHIISTTLSRYIASNITADDLVIGPNIDSSDVLKAVENMSSSFGDFWSDALVEIKHTIRYRVLNTNTTLFKNIHSHIEFDNVRICFFHNLNTEDQVNIFHTLYEKYPEATFIILYEFHMSDSKVYKSLKKNDDLQYITNCDKINKIYFLKKLWGELTIEDIDEFTSGPLGLLLSKGYVINDFEEKTDLPHDWNEITKDQKITSMEEYEEYCRFNK